MSINIDINTKVWNSIWKPSNDFVCSALKAIVISVNDLVSDGIYNSMDGIILQISHKKYEY